MDSGLLSLAEFVSHAAAVIEDDSDGDRNVFGREVHDLLLDVVFKDSEIISVEARDQPVIRVGYRDVDKGQFHVDADRLAILNRLPMRVVLHVAEDGGLSKGRCG